MRKLLALIFSGPLLTISIVTLSLITSTLAFTPANAAPNSIEIISISEVSSTSVEILFNSSVPKKSIANYVISAAVDPSVGQAKNIKKIIKTKATGLITTVIKNLNPKVAYKFSVSAKTNKGKMISSEAVEYYSLSNLMDVLSNLPVGWGNPTPIPTPTPTPTPTQTATPIAAPAFTLSSSSETRTVNTAATGFTITSTGGAIASFAISATPAGMSFNLSTGALTGTPTSVAVATAYTITATNATGSATQTFTLTVTVGAALKVAVTRASVEESPGIAFTIQPQITIQDSGGNTITSSTAVVTATVSAGGTLVGTDTATASSGIATFSNLGIRGFGGTAYTITYTAEGLTAATQSDTLSALIVGNTGPGGGKIFYVAATSVGFTCGSALSETCYYLEAASTTATTNPWTDVQRAWSTVGNQGISVPNGATGTDIGTGYKNSLAIVAQTNNVEASSAAVAARGYAGPNSLSDWYLPSKDELNQMCKWQRGITGGDLTTLTTVCTEGNLNSGTGAAGFTDDFYWSSSEFGESSAWYPHFTNGTQRTIAKTNTFDVRPVRAF